MEDMNKNAIDKELKNSEKMSVNLDGQLSAEELEKTNGGDIGDLFNGIFSTVTINRYQGPSTSSDSSTNE